MPMTIDEILNLPPACTVKQTQEALGISQDLAYDLIHSGEIPSLKLGRRFVVTRATILRMLDLDGGGKQQGDK